MLIGLRNHLFQRKGNPFKQSFDPVVVHAR